MTRFRPLILGSGGFLGRALFRHFAPDQPVGLSSRAPAGSPEHLDLAHSPVLDVERIAALGVTHALFCSALAGPDPCARDPETAWRFNVRHTLACARSLGAVGIKVVHLSSESVFDGRDGYFDEGDAPCPRSVYGRTKAEAEAGILALSDRHLVLRLSRVEGEGGPPLIDALVRALAGGERVRVAADQMLAPLALRDFLALTAYALTEDLRGVWHVANPWPAGRYPLAMACRREFAARGLPCAGIDAVRLADFPTLEPRPRAALLNPARLIARSGYRCATPAELTAEAVERLA